MAVRSGFGLFLRARVSAAAADSIRASASSSRTSVLTAPVMTAASRSCRRWRATPMASRFQISGLPTRRSRWSSSRRPVGALRPADCRDADLATVSADPNHPGRRGCRPRAAARSRYPEFLRFILSRDGQRALVAQSGYLPLGSKYVRAQLRKLDELSRCRAASGCGPGSRQERVMTALQRQELASSPGHPPGGLIRVWGNPGFQPLAQRWAQLFVPAILRTESPCT